MGATTAGRRPVARRTHAELEQITAGLEAPFALVDLDAMWSNAAEMASRTHGKPIRVASKSLRCRELLRRILERLSFRGLMTFTMPESLWLDCEGFDDLLCAYPTTDRSALHALARSESARLPIVMVDSAAHLDLIDHACGAAPARRPVRVCIEFDTRGAHAQTALGGSGHRGRHLLLVRGALDGNRSAALLARPVGPGGHRASIGWAGASAASVRVGGSPAEGAVVKVVIAGGHGQIALRLTRLLDARGEAVTGLIRNADHADDVRAAGAEPVVCDLERAEPDEVAAAVERADVVVFAAGAGPGSGEARKETMDLGGAVKLIEAAKAKGVPRYLMISSMGADPDAEGEGFAVYLRAKGRADAALVESGLAYTIVRPGRLTNDAGTGRVTIAESVGRAEIPRDDVAAVLAALIAREDTAGLLFEVVSGDERVEEALAAFVEAR